MFVYGFVTGGGTEGARLSLYSLTKLGREKKRLRREGVYEESDNLHVDLKLTMRHEFTSYILPS